MREGQIYLLISYVVFILLWSIISLRLRSINQNWNFTPKWHRYLVPAFRIFFLASLPLEFILAKREFIPALYGLGFSGTLFWLARRGFMVFNNKQPLKTFESISYNVYYVANLICFGLLMHSFVCLSLLINVSTIFLLIRVKHFKIISEVA